MPYKTFNGWLFDGDRTSPIPVPKFTDKGKVLVPDILKYNSPITHTFALQLFMRNGPLNYYLDKYFNDINVRYLSREELFLFLKKCVMDFKVNKRDSVFYPFRSKNKLFNILKIKLPELKGYDISLLCDIIEKSPDKTSIYNALNLEVPKKKKVKLGQTKDKEKKKISLKEFLEEHFSII
jgi:hypothetical protein